MRKIIFLFTLAGLVVLTGCGNGATTDETSVKLKKAETGADSAGYGEMGKAPAAGRTPDSRETAKTGAFVSVDYIDFEAVIITEENFDEVNVEFDGGLSVSELESSTRIALTINNHRDDLTVFDYKELSTLDGAAARDWRQLSERMGGHHVSGVLTFPKAENPRTLIITDLPAGDAVLTF